MNMELFTCVVYDNKSEFVIFYELRHTMLAFANSEVWSEVPPAEFGQINFN
jgi:hypothetical protein